MCHWFTRRIMVKKTKSQMLSKDPYFMGIRSLGPWNLRARGWNIGPKNLVVRIQWT